MSGPAVGARGMVASSQRLATQVGVELLAAGGSAVDAAIGVNALLSLIEPHMCGPGGDLFAIVYDPADDALHGLNASGRAPAGQTLAALRARLGDAPAIPLNGVSAITVPGAVAGWAALHERFGRLPLATVLAPVVEHAAAGVDIGPATAAWWARSAAVVTDDAALGAVVDDFRAVYLPGGRA
ncbi:MAG: gamma-glutamyltransferase, partial [Gammaproteobacteria bacterium]